MEISLSKRSVNVSRSYVALSKLDPWDVEAVGNSVNRNRSRTSIFHPSLGGSLFNRFYPIGTETKGEGVNIIAIISRESFSSKNKKDKMMFSSKSFCRKLDRYPTGGGGIRGMFHELG